MRFSLQKREKAGILRISQEGLGEEEQQMFHPIAFDNIRVVLEGGMYERDFDGEITITGRSDTMDLAIYERRFQVEFRLANREGEDPATVQARLQLATTLSDIAAEQLQEPRLTEVIGCTICIHFFLRVRDVPKEAAEIAELLNRVWGNRPTVTQTVKADWHELQPWPPRYYTNQVTLDFQRKITEGNIEDLRDLLDHMVISLQTLQEFADHRYRAQ